jgi:membrane-bound lytic murein transglycosylase B
MRESRKLILAVAGGLALATLLAVGIASIPTGPAKPFPQQSAVPPLASTPTGPGYVGLIDPAWAKRTALATGIPQQAVLAYAGAVIRSREVTPDCGLGWNTIAAIGLVESDHGRHGGSVVGADFVVSPPIYGVILDGGDTANIPDSDGGAIDGDAQYDRAVGPMQIIPQTWKSWLSDGNGDAKGDPQNIADAAVAAANYLCHASGGMAKGSGWRAGIAAYNAGSSYLSAISAAAQKYFNESR